MPSERVQRQVDSLLDEAEAGIRMNDWATVRARAQQALTLDPDNPDALALLDAAERGIGSSAPSTPTPSPQSTVPAATQPTAFANGRYTVTRFLGEGGKKKVYLARDSLLDRDVAFALIKTEGLDEASRVRVQREAQAMGRLGAHPHIVTVFDIGEENGQPYLVLPVLGGGDVEGVIENAPENKLTIERAVKIALDTCLGLEFAHSKGIVHRDLKPGNVWLTEDGRAMIGDFGLAVAVDKSRLTQAGMMVGTVSYMPPEQAMGGEVGPRSDLYSLGAMLYEMVCGRPPFVGDESVAIIGQHLNTPPVAPSWHRPDCPPALEALILRLLEKDPTKRPASATNVREALESITPAATPRQATVAQELPAGDNPLYRRTFVGRENEVRQLQQAFDAALSGQGGLVMVVGEPGIGKTALCEQLATYVALRGGKALVGHCYEEGSLSLPYLAFVEAMRSYVLAREPDGLRSDLGTGAADVARIVSEVRDRVHGVELRPAGDPEDDRWRLLQAVTSFLRNASTVQPLCIVLEDLHWADRGTLDLLLHASRNLHGARLLVVGTYRDVEVDRSHPLSGILADLRRIEGFSRVPLRGLTVDEVHRMYQALRGNDVPWAQAEAVHRATEGNPLFVQEVLRYLVEEGFVVREDGRYVAAQGVGAGIPEGLRDVVGKRLSRLSPECNRLLAIAAVIGRDFDLQTLRGVANQPEDELLNAIEEAVRVGVLEERSLPGAVRYRFGHAFFRQSLYEEMIAPRRLRLHQEVARALESQYASRREEHAAELAEHYGQSTDRADLAKAVEYSELAAKRAMAVFAYAEAESHLLRCVEVQEVLDIDNKQRRCDLLLALGDAMLPQGNPGRVMMEVSPKAFDLSEALHDDSRAARVAVQAIEAFQRSSTGRTAALRWESDEAVMWLQRADAFARPNTMERIATELALGLASLRGGSPTKGHVHLRNAIEQARIVGDAGSFFAAASSAAGFLNSLQDYDFVQELCAEVMQRSHEGVRSIDLIECLLAVAPKLLGAGFRELAEKAGAEAIALAERANDASLMVRVMNWPAHLAYVDGNFDDVLALEQNQRTRGEDLGITVLRTPYGSRTLFLTGRANELQAVEGGGRVGEVERINFAAFQGRYAEARAKIRYFDSMSSEEDESSIEMMSMLLEASVLSADEDAALFLRRRLDKISRTLSRGTKSVPRLLGRASVLLGEREVARIYYQMSLEACATIRFRPEIALTHLDFAELLLEHYPDEHDAAIEHLDFAIAELRDMKMQPALERALRHRGLLKA